MPIIDITNRCNMQCVYCCRGDMQGKNSIELDVEEILYCVKQFINVNGRFVVLQGGEPLLHKNIVEILNSLADIRCRNYVSYYVEMRNLIMKKLRGQSCVNGYRAVLARSGFPLFYVSSNGMIYSADIHNALKKAECVLEISLDSADPIINAKTRIGANMDIIQKNIREYTKDIPVSIACTITESNMNHLEDLVTLAVKLGCVSLKLSPVVAIGKRKDSFIDFVEDYAEALKKVVRRLEEESYKIIVDIKTIGSSVEGYQYIYDFLNVIPNVFVEQHYCDAIRSSNNIYVDPEMNVYGCASMKNFKSLQLGNLREDNLAKILTSDKAQTLIKRIASCIESDRCTAEKFRE